MTYATLARALRAQAKEQGRILPRSLPDDSVVWFTVHRVTGKGPRLELAEWQAMIDRVETLEGFLHTLASLPATLFESDEAN
jgi:hypothetical protein